MDDKLVNPSKYLGNELKYLEMVLASESWSGTGGSWNNALEAAFCEKTGAKYAIAMNSGTATLHAALLSIGVETGDEVISPALTVIMDSTATIHAGGIPVYADIDPHTFNIDPKDIERKITPKTKAIIPVALYGLTPDLESIMALAGKYGLYVIEDNAQTYKETLEGHFSSFSFETTKHISCGEGGMLVTNDPDLAQKARKIAGHGFKNLTAGEGRVRLNQDVFQNPGYKRHDTIGFNYRMPEFNAAVALAQLERIEALVFMRQRSAEYLIDAMTHCDYLISQEGEDNTYYTLGVVYEGEKSIGVSWERFRETYIKNGGDGIYGAWSVPYLEPALYNGYSHNQCPIAESIQPKLMQFKTNYRDLALADIKAMALLKTIKGYE